MVIIATVAFTMRHWHYTPGVNCGYSIIYNLDNYKAACTLSLRLAADGRMDDACCTEMGKQFQHWRPAGAGSRGRATAPRPLALFAAPQLGDYTQILQRGDVALDFAAGSQFAQQAAHDFAAARFGQHVAEADVVGLGQSANLLGHPLAQLFF